MNNVSQDRRPIVENCAGCDRILKAEGDGQLCAAFAYPEAKWRLGPCSMATHVKLEAAKGTEKTRVGQQKQKKR
jgi:hypothetical protein